MLMWLIHFILGFLLVRFIHGEEYEVLSKRVREYLNKVELTPRQNVNWLQNSNKIGLGYDILEGSPVCYTGDCQMDGFRRSIFNLTYSSSSPGTCSSKLIPDNVEIDCQPSALTTANTEEFSKLKQLKESTSSGIDVSASFQGWGALSALSFGYGFSRQTTYMVDNIIQQGSTMFFTSSKVSHVKLSMFEPEMPLSNRFVYTIKNMPCCVFNSSVQQYVKEFIFGYFGFAYITELMLGGVAQRLVRIRTIDVTKLESEGVNTKHEAKIGFYITMGTTITSGYEKTTQDKFSSKIQNEQSARLGGDASVKDLDEWAKTVPDNPVVIRFKIKFFFDLFTSKRFPNDPQIDEKSKLIQQVLSEYGKQPPYCYNNCTSPMHGTCTPFEGFNFGVCKCNPGFSGECISV